MSPRIRLESDSGAFMYYWGQGKCCTYRLSESKRYHQLSDALISSNGKVNYICVGEDCFIKYWRQNEPVQENPLAHYSFYKIQELAFGYFISNLIEDVYINTQNENLPRTLAAMFYPIQESKEAHKVTEVSCEV